MPSPKRERQREGRQLRQEQVRAAERRKRQRGLFVRFLAVGVIAFVVVFLVTRAQNDDNDGDDTAASSSTTETTAEPTDTTASTTPADKFGTTACPKADGSSPKTLVFEAPFAKCIDTAKTYKAKVVTDAGEYTITFDAEAAPATVNNFVSLARFHYYDGLTYHRVIPDFVVQGGDPEGTGSGGPGYQFADELPQAGAYEVGSVAMANSGPNTNGSQFFVITGQQGVQLPPSYSLFGKVTAGMDVVKKIEADGTPAGTPKVVHKMTSVTITEES